MDGLAAERGERARLETVEAPEGVPRVGHHPVPPGRNREIGCLFRGGGDRPNRVQVAEGMLRSGDDEDAEEQHRETGHRVPAHLRAPRERQRHEQADDEEVGSVVVVTDERVPEEHVEDAHDEEAETELPRAAE